MPAPLNRIAFFCDDIGFNQLVSFVPTDRIAAVVGAVVRPECHEALREGAKAQGIPFLIQPKKTDEAAMGSFIEALRDLAPDALFSNSYSQLIPDAALEMVGEQAFNIHYSLLPRNRGCQPIRWALIHGEALVGVSLHQMSGAFDSGPVIAQAPVDIEDDDNWVSLIEKVFLKSYGLLGEAMPALLSGDWVAQPQDESLASYNKRLPEEGVEIDFDQMNDRQVVNLLRALCDPGQGAYLKTQAGEMRVKEALSLPEVQALRQKYAAN